MDWLQGRVVQFHLSAEGRQELSGAVAKDQILGLVEVVDDLGPWILVGKPGVGETRPLMLLKWDYFSTAVLEIGPKQEEPKLRIGFTG